MDKFLIKKTKMPQQKMDIEGQTKVSTTPWVQKYRPNNLDEISHQEQVTESLKSVLKNGNLPHLLFYGPAGTGKTSAIIALAKQLYGPKFYRERIKQLNASDERGINVIRNKVKQFAQRALTKNHDKNYNCPDFKIIILDQADLMTNDAQSALRRIIEDYSTTTRFCIICNFVTKIIEPLASRCVKFRFKPIPQDSQLKKLNQICQKQNLNIKMQHLKTLMNKGDLRQTINALQAFSNLPKLIPNFLPIQNEIPRKIMQDIKSAKNLKEVAQIYEQIIAEGFALDELIGGLIKQVLKWDDQRRKSILLQLLSSCEAKLLGGGSQLSVKNFTTQAYFLMNTRL